MIDRQLEGLKIPAPQTNFDIGKKKKQLEVENILEQRFSTFVRPQPGKFFFHKTRAQSQQIYS